MFDFLICSATVYDGSGSAEKIADVAIKDGKIAAIGSLPLAACRCRIQANGRALLPGFIDVHTHSDAVIANGCSREEVICQGVTTEIISACGIGPVPLDKSEHEYLNTVKAIMGPLSEHIDTRSVSSFLRTTNSCATNYALQLAHSPLRYHVAGSWDIDLSEHQLQEMEQELRNAFMQGACAFSTGLAYYPASFCNTSELIRLCCVAKEFEAPFCIHQRSVVNRHFSNGIQPLTEAFEIAKKSKVHLHLSHYKTRPASIGAVSALVEPIERALDAGLSVTADFYPFPVGCGYVAVNLPLWVMEGTFSDIIARLEDPSLQSLIAAQMEQEHPNLADGIFTQTPKHPEYLGMRYAQVAAESGESVARMLIRVLREEALDCGYMPGFTATEKESAAFWDDFAALLKKTYYMVGSDTLPAHGRPHPRSYSTFSTILSIAKNHHLSLGLIANRLSTAPAELFHLEGRGKIAEGNFADLILLDPENQVSDVWINGKQAVSEKAFRSGYLGKPLRARHRSSNQGDNL